MANDNKKINKLDPVSEDDLTAELEIPAFFSDQLESAAQELDADAETCEIKLLDVQADLDEPSIGTPQSGTEPIDQLQSDIEQLRIKWTGLEKEISKKFNAEIDQLNAKLKSSKRELGDRQRKLDTARHELEQEKQSAKESSAETAQIRTAAKNDESRIRDLEKQLAANKKKVGSVKLKLKESRSRQRQDSQKSASHERRLSELKKQLAESQASLSELRKHVDDRKDIWTQREDELAEVKTSLEKSGNEIEELSKILTHRDTQLERNQSRIDELSKELATQVSECTNLRSDNLELRRISRNDAEKEIERSHKLIAEQSGLLTGREQEISDLTAQINRTERYADDLRHQLQEQSEFVESAVNREQDLQTACTSAQDKIGDLSEELTATKQQNAVLSAKIDKLEQNFSQEYRKTRFELGAAQETIADQDTINVQLTSDLYDTKGVQRSLETQLNEVEERYQEVIRQLEQKAKKLKIKVDDFEYKLENKDRAIAALMNELAGRSQTVESADEIEDVILDIGEVFVDSDDQVSERAEETTRSDRVRVTRLLVGETDGQEVRFPLFKDRLTIGRTANNDIQLNAHFISRRHAVIVTENGETKIVDWGSKNGVFVNEKRVTEQTLKNGDIVTIGTTEFRYEERPKR